MVQEYSGWHWINDDPARSPLVPALQQLGTIQMPTLIIVGERSAPDMQRIANILERELPDARKYMLHAGHMANMELPQEFNQVVLDFLAECCA
jgi:pimeloyl-ACP methyl ester carboxylesterase